jgi:hypothetical protein
MIAIIKGEKTRPVLNVSVPEGNSFNDNVEILDVEKVHMDTARTFSYLLPMSSLLLPMSSLLLPMSSLFATVSLTGERVGMRPN